MKITVDIMQNGDIQFVEPKVNFLEDLGETRFRRISRVEPANLFKRIAFKVIRRLVSDSSAIAQWTRNWKCSWRVKMLDTGYIFGEFEQRQEAIAAEIERWNNCESLEG